MNSREKGKRVERQARDLLREYGFTARRGQQFRGGPDSPDIICNLPIHFEVKGRERGNPYDWIEQAARECGNGQTPTVLWRRNGKPFLSIRYATDDLDIIRRSDLPDICKQT
jgi:Holliday junction resolvase